MDKKTLFRKLNENLALEQAIIEAEGTIAGRSSIPDVRQAAGVALRDDEDHLVILRRMINDLGGRVEPASMDTVAWIEALVQNINSTRDELDSLSLLRMLKSRAVATGEVFDRIRFTLGNPPEMEGLVTALRQDREHAQRYAQLESVLVSREIML
jgi:hypothetical protein